MTLMAGFATAVATVAVHQWWWGLVLAVTATLALLLVAPPGGWTRLPFAAGFAGCVLLVSLPRAEGDYLIAASAPGYAVLATALVVLLLSVATLPRRGRIVPDPTRE